MDGRRFDALTRALAKKTSRRRTVGALALAVVGALWGGHAPAAAAQVGSCAGKQHGQSCGQCGLCVGLAESDTVQCVPIPLNCRVGGRLDNDACGYCEPDTFTCGPPRTCGPCEKCLAAAEKGCTYVPRGRDGQCDPTTNPCDPATGKCHCARDRHFCDPDCADLQTDPKHCGQCHHPCRSCEHCREGMCVPCDETCERCDEQVGCISTCEDLCKACQDGRCVKPNPPICVCGAEDEGASPTAKRITLPVVTALGEDSARLEPCGEGDKAQCCVPEQCCGEGDKQQCCAEENCCGEGARAECCAAGHTCLNASEGGKICCLPELVCGDVCCAGGEECSEPGCCCWALDMTPQGICSNCRSGA